MAGAQILQYIATGYLIGFGTGLFVAIAKKFVNKIFN